MVRIVQINSVNGIYSTGKIVMQLGNLIIHNDNWESYIFHKQHPVIIESLSRSEIVGNKLDYLIHKGLAFLFDGQGLGSILSTLSLVNKLKRIRPDIVHLHNIHDYYINYPILFNYFRKSKIKVVWTMHDCWTITGHCSSPFSCAKYLSKCNDCEQRTKYMPSVIDFSYRNFSCKAKLFTMVDSLYVVTVSDWLKGIMENSFLRSKPIERIYNGIDLSKFYYRNNCSDLKRSLDIDNKFIALAVAQHWTERKGINDYYKLAQLLGEDVLIIIIGSVPAPVSPLPPNMRIIKNTTNVDELCQFYSLADVVLNLSYSETFGLTTVEGFACGTPTIVYNITASPELVSANTGFIVEPGDIDSVKKRILDIKIKGRSFFSNHCIKRANEFFDMEKNFNLYVDLYKKILTIGANEN